MSRNGSGTYSLPYPTFVTGTQISSSQVNANNADLTAAMTASLPRDGQAAPTANIPFGSYKITGLGAGTAATDSLTLGQAQAQAFVFATVGGTADAITLTVSPVITAYAAGQCFRFIAGADNTGAVTVNVSAVGAKDIKKTTSAAAADLSAGDIKEAGVYEIVYDGTQFRLFDVVEAITSSDITGQTEATIAAGDTIIFSDADDSGSLKKDTIQGILDLFAHIPVGLVSPYGGSTAPSGWLLCYGQAVSRSTYSGLFAVVGTTFGAGDGSTTFNVPDIRGRVVAGQDDMGGTSANRLTGQTYGVDGDVLGGVGGSETQAITQDQLPALAGSNRYVTTDLNNAVNQKGSVVSSASIATYRQAEFNPAGDAHNNVQPTIILNYIIKT